MYSSGRDLRESEESLLEIGAGDLQVAGGGIAMEQSADRGVRVGAVQQNGIATNLGLADPREKLQRRRISTWKGGPDRSAANRRLDLGCRAVGNDHALADQNDPISERIGFLQVMRGEQHGTAGRREVPHRTPERVPGLDVHRDRGSSRMRKSGSGTSDIAKRTRCVWPPESFSDRRLAMSSMRARLRTSSTGMALG